MKEYMRGNASFIHSRGSVAMDQPGLKNPGFFYLCRMNNCKNCGVSVFDKPLHRINPLGRIGQFMCQDCIEEIVNFAKKSK